MNNKLISTLIKKWKKKEHVVISNSALGEITRK